MEARYLGSYLEKSKQNVDLMIKNKYGVEEAVDLDSLKNNTKDRGEYLKGLSTLVGYKPFWLEEVNTIFSGIVNDYFDKDPSKLTDLVKYVVAVHDPSQEKAHFDFDKDSNTLTFKWSFINGAQTGPRGFPQESLLFSIDSCLKLLKDVKRPIHFQKLKTRFDEIFQEVKKSAVEFKTDKDIQKEISYFRAYLDNSKKIC